jgi:hypothetical protein
VTAARAHAPWAFRVPVQVAAVVVVADTLPVSAEAPAISAEAWGSGCPIAMRERIAELEAAARADQSLRSVAAHAAGMQPASADDPEWPPRWEAIASGRISKAEAERDAARKDLAALRGYLTRSVADDIAVQDAWDILHNLAPDDLARVLKWVEEIDWRPKKPVQIPAALFHRLLSAGLKDAEGDVLEWITARVERCAELEADMRTAAGELLVPMSKPGTHMARLLSANVLMRRELAELRTLGASIHKAVATALEARAKQIDAKADAAFDGAAMYGAPFSQGKGEAALARREAYRVAARIVRGP